VPLVQVLQREDVVGKKPRLARESVALRGRLSVLPSKLRHATVNTTRARRRIANSMFGVRSLA
jgi:hypothetical protein